MSAIDFYCSVDKVGADGKTRYMVLMEKIVWKYLPYAKQVSISFHCLLASLLLLSSSFMLNYLPSIWTILELNIC